MFKIELSNEQLEVVLQCLDKSCQGVQASSLVLPVFAAIKDQLEKQSKTSDKD